jgi:allantoinase
MGASSAQYTLRSTRVVLPSGVHPADVRVSDGRIASIDVHPTSRLPASAAERLRQGLVEARPDSDADVGGQPRTRPPEGGSRQPPSSIPNTPNSRLRQDYGGQATELRDVGDLVIMPGIVDTHVHVNEPGRTEWEGFATATAAAVAGGITTIVDMPLNCIPATTTRGALEVKREAARDAAIEIAFWGGVVPGNAGELDALADAGVRGFKCFLSPSGVDEFTAVEESDLRLALPILERRGLPLLAHAEWPPALRPIPAGANTRAYGTWLASRPPGAEVDAIAILISLCREFRTRIHIVHLAAAAALPLLRAARAEGLPITVETCPHYLTFAAEEIPDEATQFKCAPPIRDRANRDALWQALVDGDIDLIATDHSPCPPAMKGDSDFIASWGGIASLELSLPVVWTGASARGIPLERVANWLSDAPARLAGLHPAKGTITPGSDADFVIWNPEADFIVDERRLRQRYKRTPYEGRHLRGRVMETYARGLVVYREGAAHP